MEENHKDKGKRYKVMAGIDQVFSDSFTSKKIFGNDGFQFFLFQKRWKNIVGDMLAKQGYDLYFYRNEKSTLEMDFFIRDARSLIPVEVKTTDSATKSLTKLTAQDGKYPDIRYGIKLCNKNIGFNGKFYTFPYFLTFLLKRFVRRDL